MLSGVCDDPPRTPAVLDHPRRPRMARGVGGFDGMGMSARIGPWAEYWSAEDKRRAEQDAFECHGHAIKAIRHRMIRDGEVIPYEGEQVDMVLMCAIPCAKLGRKFIGIEIEPDLFVAPQPKPVQESML